MDYKVIVLDSCDEDPYVDIRDFVEKNGNPIYLYQGGSDDMVCIVSSQLLIERQLKAIFEAGE